MIFSQYLQSSTDLESGLELDLSGVKDFELSDVKEIGLVEGCLDREQRLGK